MKKLEQNQRKRSEKGITLIPLLITVAIMLVIIGIALGNGLQSAENVGLQSFYRELQIIQKRVDIITEEARAGENNYITYQADTQSFMSNHLGREAREEDEIDGVSNKEGYYYYDQEALKILGIEEVEQEVYINWKTRDVVSAKGFSANGIMYYRDPSVFKPNYEEEKQKVILEKENIQITGRSMKQVQVVNVTTEDGQKVNSFEMKYREYDENNNQNPWKTAENGRFQTSIPGTYQIQIERKPHYNRVDSNYVRARI